MRTPQLGGGALEGEANTGEYGKQSPVLRRTDPSRASGRGRLWSPERPSSTPGLSLLSGGAHLRPVPAAPSPRPGPRGPLGGGALGPAAVIAGPRPGRAWAAARTHGHGPRQGPRREGRAPGRRRGLTFCRIWPDVDTLRISFCGEPGSASGSLSEDSSGGGGGGG